MLSSDKLSRHIKRALYLFIVVIILFCMIEVPFSLVFKLKTSFNALLIDLFISLVFITDSIFNNKGRKWKLNFLSISEFLSIIPYDLLNFVFGIPPFFSLLRILRIFRLFDLINKVTHSLKRVFMPISLKATLIFSIAIVALNFISCGWIWVTPSPEGASIFKIYIDALYWTITTLTTIGYGDITPISTEARIFTMFIMIAGLAVYGLVIGFFSKVIAMKSRYKEEMEMRIHDLNVFMDHYEIPQTLQDAAFSYYYNIMSKRLSMDDQQIVSELPMALQNKFQLYVNMKLIESISLFTNCPKKCLESMASNMEQKYFSPNEMIISKGDIGHEMYIIGHGSVEVDTKDMPKITLKSGHFFGEKALLEKTTRNANVKTVDYCEIYILDKDNFVELIAKYPILLDNIKKHLKGK